MSNLDPATGLEFFEVAVASMPSTEKSQWLKKFEDNPVRGIFALELRKMIREQQITLETVDPDDVKKVQGVLKGLRMTHALLTNCAKLQP